MYWTRRKGNVAHTSGLFLIVYSPPTLQYDYRQNQAQNANRIGERITHDRFCE